jgi:D-alanyl-D-alanine carboxypeptidase
MNANFFFVSESKWARAFLLLLVLTIISSCTGRNGSEPPSAGQAWSQNDLEQVLETWRRESGIPGVVVGISQSNQAKIIITSGVSSLQEETPISEHAQFRIASIAKTFIAAEILKLSAQDKVKMDAPISDYLSDVPFGDEVTVRQLLSHRSGYFDPARDDPNFIPAIAKDMNRLWTWQEVLNQAYGHPLYFEPGTGYDYSDTNYLLLGLLIKHVIGQSLGDVLTADFINPLQLKHTLYETLDTDLAQTNLVHGYAENPLNGQTEDILASPQSALVTVSPNIISDSSDMLKWSRALYGKDAEALGHELQSEMLTFDEMSPYGLGVFKSNTSMGISYGHGGETAGYQSLMQYFPAQDLSIVILANMGFPSSDLNGLLQSLLNVMYSTSAATEIDRLMADLSSNIPALRRDAIVALGHSGHAAEKAIPSLILILETDPSAENRKEAALALGLLGRNSEPAKQALMDATQDNDESVREAARLALNVLK